MSWVRTILVAASAGSCFWASTPARAASPIPEGFPIHPILLGEADYRHYSGGEAEGESGFALARFRMGVALKPTPWFTAVGSGEWTLDKVRLVDGWIRVRPKPWLEVSAGYGKTPLFSSSRDEAVEDLAVPELAPVVEALWPGRDLGVEVHVAPPPIPIEVWARLGNGSASPLGNDNPSLSGDVRVDLALGRARPAAEQTAPLGLRVGAGGHAEDTADRPGITTTTAGGFTFFRPPTVSGPRLVAEGHMVLHAGPVRVSVEGGWAREDRSLDTDGNPDTPRAPLDPMYSRGVTAEVAVTVRGTPRAPGSAPTDAALDGTGWRGGAVEVAGRFDRVDLGRGAGDIEPGGATGGALAAHWWATDFLAVAVAGYVLKYDSPPLEEPDRTWSTFVLARATARWR